ncbi:hypothetical protein CLLI_01270 [Clostridium liquoris]|uniref:Lantibiotic dehydratase N-terminal domain-containing protein n=1 Tax=Clostridium liquoris TaxID=1289519 RepID=A0A2T0B9I8_9CLOT|nr:lantibiotic dehydratase family protein [Clostridium liquoris]PRR80554.1 hypothetical protein CLLI_01270 [Clostridium liquoris]
MKYLCHDIFMVRVPSLPVKIFRDFHKTNGNISDYISENEDVMNFMKESVLLSSKSLYNSLNNPPTEKKKIKNYKLGLLKYFTRASTRPTPYGLFAGVGLGSFSDKTKIIVDENKFKRDIKVDTYWICHVIHDLESDMKIASQLKLKFNPICFISGDRVKNPYFSNHGDINKYDDYVKENSIRYTPLIKLIKEKSQDFTSFQDIKKEILKVYTNAPDELLNNTLMQLIENEYLITELRLPAYCDDAMGYIIKILQDKSGVEELLNKLQGINKSIALYRNSNERLDRIKILEDIYKNMSEMYKSKNYLEINKGLMLHENYLSDKIKEKLEKFVQTLSMIPLDSNDYCILDKFKEEFTERYGLNIEVPLVDIIDDNDFNGLNLLSDESYKLSQRESEIRKIIDNKILLALMNGEEEVNLTTDDFLKVEEIPISTNPAKSFDMNFYITKGNEDYYFTLGPNGGSSKAGSMFQRFANAFDNDLMKDYNKIYEKEVELTKEDYILVEARELSTTGRSNNVTNRFKNYDYYLAIACTDKSAKEEIPINDLYIGISHRRELYIKSKSRNKKVKVVVDNMLNPALNSKLLNLLRKISNEYENQIVGRAFMQGKNEYIYTSRIKIEGVTVRPRKWKFGSNDLIIRDFDGFKKSFLSASSEYKIDKYVYICENDNRLIVDIKSPDALEIMYSTIKKQKNLELSEVEQGIFNEGIVKDLEGNNYISEFVFSFIQKSNEEVMLEKKETNFSN